jgi:DNA-binding CsgD family transcriptional regulator/sugar-specific transcriptional regulator TrmB
MLEALGLDAEAETVYRFMLAHRTWGAAQIAEGLGWRKEKVHKALDRLADLTLLRQSQDTPSTLAPVHPELGLQALLQREEAQLFERQQRLAKSRAASTQLIADYLAIHHRKASQDAYWLDGLDSIRSRLEELAERTQSVCMSLMPSGLRSGESIDAIKLLDELMMGRGVKVLTVFPESVRNHLPTYNYACWLSEHGGEVRTTPTLPIRMQLFDRRAALLPADSDDPANGVVQVNFPSVVLALTELFEQVWESGIALGRPAQQDEYELKSQERELLRLLSRGLTDEAAARHLGVSLRTERRMVASIMQRLGAQSRFQAAIRATQRHWLP